MKDAGKGLSKRKRHGGSRLQRFKRDLMLGAAGACGTVMTSPVAMAFAKDVKSSTTSDANSMLKQLMGFISTGVLIGGLVLAVWGGVRLGLAIKEHQGGSQMSEAIFTLAGGIVVAVAGGFFKAFGSTYKF